MKKGIYEPFSVTTKSDGLSDLIHDGTPFAFDERDIALSHTPNSELRKQSNVMQFMDDIKKYKTLDDPNSRAQLGSLPLRMVEQVIPVVDCKYGPNGAVEDYQLHPCFTWLQLGKAATSPHVNLFRLSVEDNYDMRKIRPPNLVMGLGRLFVYRHNSSSEKHRSMWTGFELFLDKSLSVWMAFDKQLLNPTALDVVPFTRRCCLTTLQHLTSYWRREIGLSLFDTSGIISQRPFSDDRSDFDIARLGLLSNLFYCGRNESLSFYGIAGNVLETHGNTETLQLDQISRSEKLEFDS